MLGDPEYDWEVEASEYLTSLFHEKDIGKILNHLPGLNAEDIQFFQYIYIEKMPGETTNRRIDIMLSGGRMFRKIVSIEELRQLKALNDAKKAHEASSERGVGSFSGSLASNSRTLEDALRADLPPPPPPSFSPPSLSDYHFYQGLLEAIQSSKMEKYEKGKGKKKRDHFKEQIHAAEQKLIEHKKNWGVALADEQKELLENIRGMLIALEVLSRNQAKYTDVYLNARLIKILENVPDPYKGDVFAELKSLIDYNVLKGRKALQGGNKSVIFNAKQPTMQGAPADKRAKRLKIEHETENGNKIVKATFGYDRTRLFGKSTGSKIGDRAKKYEEFQKQISDFAAIAIYEYGKGVTEDKPLTISYTDSKQPEAALALLLEYKKRAFLEDKSFYALNHKRELIEITPREGFSDDEKAYFLHYANSEPEIPNRSGKPRPTGKCAGYCLLELENEGVSVSEAKKHAINEGDLVDLLQKRLAKENAENIIVVEDDPHPNPHAQF